MVVCHLGGGASLCAIKNGKSIDTTMGFTPLDGLMMNTRCGSVDPGIVLHLLKSRKLDDVEHELYHKSGLLGISGFSDDMRDILRERDNGNDRAILAFDIYVHRLNQAIGSMMASLQGLDVLVLTGGIGENTPLLREKLQQNWAFLGNDVEFLVMHTDEASEIARESLRLFC